MRDLLQPPLARPLVAEIDSGRLEMKTAARYAAPTAPPSKIVRPITIDSGTPSSTLPSTMASAEPLAWSPPASLRSPPPRRSISQSPPAKTAQPAKRPPTNAPSPVDFSDASWTRSNATALISTPAPKPMISPITRSGMRKRSAMIAPITSEHAARVP